MQAFGKETIANDLMRLQHHYFIRQGLTSSQQAIKTSILWSTIFCVVFGLIAAIFPEGIMSLFTKEDMEMVNVGSIALRATYRKNTLYLYR